MKTEAVAWLRYAQENLNIAELAISHEHFNACLYNSQQAAEKYLKSVIVELALEFKRTHNILRLRQLLIEAGVDDVGLTEDECDLLDAIYMPSRYPLAGVLPDAMPDREICKRCLHIAHRVRDSVTEYLYGL